MTTNKPQRLLNRRTYIKFWDQIRKEWAYPYKINKGILPQVFNNRKGYIKGIGHYLSQGSIPYKCPKKEIIN